MIRSRVSTSGKGTSAHFGVYGFIPDVLHLHPLFGLGYNNFSVYYEFVTGKTNWGPHSYYVALLVEGGLVGTALFAGVPRLPAAPARRRAAHRPRARGRRRSARRARVRPLAWGMTAALSATMAANAFYLTLSFFYFFVFAAIALATPIVFGRAVPTDARGVAAGDMRAGLTPAVAVRAVRRASSGGSSAPRAPAAGRRRRRPSGLSCAGGTGRTKSRRPSSRRFSICIATQASFAK